MSIEWIKQAQAGYYQTPDSNEKSRIQTKQSEAAGQSYAHPEDLDPYVARVNHVTGGSSAVWMDRKSGYRLDAREWRLPTPNLNMVGMTAKWVNGAWIYGGETNNGSRPRGL